MIVIKNIYSDHARSQIDKKCIALDLDNTLIDLKGIKRNGCDELIHHIRKKGYGVMIWTNSTFQRAQDIIQAENISCDYLVPREAYDFLEFDRLKPPEWVRKMKYDNEAPKPLKLLGVSVIVDDSPDRKREGEAMKTTFIKVKPCRDASVKDNDLLEVRKKIK